MLVFFLQKYLQSYNPESKVTQDTPNYLISNFSNLIKKILFVPYEPAQIAIFLRNHDPPTCNADLGK